MIPALIDLSVKSTALLAVGTLVVLIMRRAPASARHHVWVGVLCAIALMPIARMSLPALKVAVLAAPAPAPTPAPFSISHYRETEPVAASHVTLEKFKDWTAGSATVPLPARPTWSLSLAEAFVAIWLLGIAGLIVRAAAAQRALRLLTSRATVVADERVLAILDEAAHAFRVRRSITLLSHADDALPCTFGVVRPVILMPASLLRADPEAAGRLRVALIHETAHIARLDALSERITQMAVMMFWFNPFVWLAARQARFERERAADDAVLTGGAKASDYASDLLEIARAQSKPLVSSAVPMAVSGLERRVRAILDDRIRRGRQSRMSLVATLIVLAAMLPVSAVRLVARTASPSASVQVEIPSPVALTASATASSPAPSAAQTPPPAQKVEQTDSLAMWNAERERNLRQVLRRARAAHQEALTKAAIGTTAPIDVTVLEKAIAQLEEAVKNFTPITTPLTPQELKSRRAVFGAFLSNLERAELRFTNGLLTTAELASALLRAAQVIEPSIQAPVPTAGSHAVHTSPFFFRPDAKATPADASRARELYSLLTGEVSFAHGAQAAVQVPQTNQSNAQSDPLAAWNAERLANLRQVLERARAAHRAALKRVEIGTTTGTVAPQLAAARTELANMLTVRNITPAHPDVKAMQATVNRLEAEAIAEPFSPVLLEKTVAALEQTVQAFTLSTTLPPVGVIEGVRAAFATAARNLEAAEIRFEHGLIRTSDLVNALMSAAQALDVQLQPIILPGLDGRGRAFFFFNNEAAAPVRAMFSEANFPGSTEKDRASAQELYALLTGRVTSISGTTSAETGSQNQRFVYITGEVKAPGKYALGDRMTVLQLLALAGGLLPSADKNQILIVSGTATDQDGKPLTRSINYNDLMKGKNLKENNLELGRGDAVIVRSPGPGYYWQR